VPPEEQKCKGYENLCFCPTCEAEDTYWAQRARRLAQERDPDTDWSWVDPYNLKQRHNAFCACSKCLTKKYVRRGATSEQLRRNVPILTQEMVDDVVSGCEALLAATPHAMFDEWCRKNGRM
jgi:hypothetical protein